ncbi:MAG TPA: hypothetical protein VKX28_30245 [Xanthobacteraceae bacterium]|nr:hypothetical protein [Xanthobacteraceae bacterium]
MSISSDRRSETWIPAPLGLATIDFTMPTLRQADRLELAAVCLFALIGLAATVVAAVAFGPTFDCGSILAAAG